nr:7929_t:CDS:2 [Entrophospora candida]
MGFLQPLSLIAHATKLGLFSSPKMEKSLNSFNPAQEINCNSPLSIALLRFLTKVVLPDTLPSSKLARRIPLLGEKAIPRIDPIQANKAAYIKVDSEKASKVGAKVPTKVEAMAVVLPTRNVNNNEAPKMENKRSTGIAITVFGNNLAAKLPDIPDTLIIEAGTAAKT